MNINCTSCDQPFSITADQLGTRGKCPHCKATIILPRSAKAGYFHDSTILTPPKYWSQTLLCVVVTFLFHATALSMIALVPWGQFANREPGDGQLVMIGKLPKNIVLDNKQEQLDTEEYLNPEADRSFDEFDTEEFSPKLVGQLAPQSLQDLSVAPSGGTESEFEFDSLFDSELMASGEEEFSAMITRLRKTGLDIVITFDSTGSMQGEIDQVKGQISRIGSVLFKMIEKTRIGICTYRDYGDTYVVDGLPLTDNLSEIILYLEKISASGGGDKPEAVDQGLAWATEQPFRKAARKVILLFGDAPPRPSKSLSCQKMASEFRRKGGIVSTVTCRNSQRMDDFVNIAESGAGEAFLTTHERQIMSQLIILVFGSQHRLKVVEAFDLLDGQ